MQRASTHRESPRRTWPARSLIALGALSALLLAGCSSGGSGSSSTVGQVGGGPARDSSGVNSAPEAKNGASGAALAPGAAAGQAASKSVAPLVGVGQKLTKSASLDLRVKDIDAAAAQVRSIATGLQASVLNEQIGDGSPGGPIPLQSRSDVQGKPEVQTSSGAVGGFGTLTLSVPADKLDIAMDQLARIGTVVQRNLSSQDVTAQYVDTESRLKTMRASVERVRALLAQAKDLGQVVTLESELSRREADLESLESQLGALKNSVERSTLSVSLSTPTTAPLASTGFVAGLRSGWDAFTASASGLFTAIGAVLPFAVFLALVAAPLLWWLRRRRQVTVGSAATVS